MNAGYSYDEYTKVVKSIEKFFGATIIAFNNFFNEHRVSCENLQTEKSMDEAVNDLIGGGELTFFCYPTDRLNDKLSFCIKFSLDDVEQFRFGVFCLRRNNEPDKITIFPNNQTNQIKELIAKNLL